MGTKNNPGAFDCHKAAEPDEPLFTLLARDPIAPEIIREWAYRRVTTGKNKITDTKIVEAFNCADQMDVYRHELEEAAEREAYNAVLEAHQ